MKFLEYVFRLMNSKFSSYVDYLFIAISVGYVAYGFLISPDAPDFWDWANLVALPLAILTLFFKPSEYVGKMIGLKAKKGH